MYNYEGSMMGSGIYSTDYEEEISCDSGYELEDGSECDYEGTVTVYVNDWGRGYYECPKCGSGTEYEKDNPDDEYEPDRYMD